MRTIFVSVFCAGLVLAASVGASAQVPITNHGAPAVAVSGLLLLMNSVGASAVEEQQFSCKGQVIRSSGEQKPAVDVSFSFGDDGKMSLKMTGDKALSSRMISNNKIQLKFATKEFVGEFFHYTGDLFLIYRSGQLTRLICSHV
jgi:hypothetical protein